MSDKSYVIMGYSGHSYVVLDACKQLKMDVMYYCDGVETLADPFDLQYLGDENKEDFDWSLEDNYILGIGHNGIRRKVYELIKSKGKNIQTVIHPHAQVNSHINIEEGTFIAAGTVINSMAKIGENCIINTGSIVEHECVIGHSSHIAPGAVLLGNVKIGENCFIGANAVIKENTIIEDNVTVGAGSVVLKNVKAGMTVVGNPAKKILR